MKKSGYEFIWFSLILIPISISILGVISSKYNRTDVDFSAALAKRNVIDSKSIDLSESTQKDLGASTSVMLFILPKNKELNDKVVEMFRHRRTQLGYEKNKIDLIGDLSNDSKQELKEKLKLDYTPNTIVAFQDKENASATLEEINKDFQRTLNVLEVAPKGTESVEPVKYLPRAGGWYFMCLFFLVGIGALGGRVWICLVRKKENNVTLMQLVYFSFSLCGAVSISWAMPELSLGSDAAIASSMFALGYGLYATMLSD